MTLTKYQRGETIDGWNDCPPVMRNTTSTMPKRRVLRNLCYDSSRESSLVDLSRASSQVDISSIHSVQPPVRRVGSNTIVSSPSNSSQEPIPYSEPSSDVTVEAVQVKLDEVLALPTQLTEKQVVFCRTKILNQLDTLPSQHLQFLHHVLDNVSHGNNYKNEVVDYMIANDGVSYWCSPLKKLFESLIPQTST